MLGWMCACGVYVGMCVVCMSGCNAWHVYCVCGICVCVVCLWGGLEVWDVCVVYACVWCVSSMSVVCVWCICGVCVCGVCGVCTV